MTVETEQSAIVFTGIMDGVALNVPFPVQATTELKVRYGAADALAVEGVNYTVALVPPEYLTATVTPMVGFAALSGGTVSVRREVPYTQPTDIPTLASLASARLEQMFDRVVFICQQLRDALTSTLRFPTTDVDANIGPLPPAADRASKYLGFDVNGKPIAIEGTSGTGVGMTSFGVAWVQLLNTAAALVSLGFTTVGAIGRALVAATTADAARIVIKVYEYDVRAFGASTANTGAQNVAAVQAMIDAQIAATGYVNLLFPQGAFPFNAKLVCTGALGVTIRGWGPTSRPYWTNSDGGIKAEMATPDSNNPGNQSALIENVSIITTAAGGGVGLDISCATAVGSTTPGAKIVNSFIGHGGNGSSQYWNTNVKLTNMRNNAIRDSEITNSQLSGRSASALIELAGGTVQTTIAGNNLAYGTIGVLIGGGCEGVFILGNPGIVYVTQGVRGVGDGSHTITDVHVKDTHISAFTFGMFFEYAAHLFIATNLLIKRDESTDNYADIRLNKNVSVAKILGNFFQLGGTSGTEDGIQLDILSNGGVDGVIIDANSFANRDKAIFIGNGGPTNVTIGVNEMASTVVTPIQNDSPTGKGIRIAVQRSAQAVNTAISGATPSLDNGRGGMFVLTNGGATNVTNFVDGYHGQIAYIIAGNGNSTIKHGASLIMAGGVDWVMGAGDVLTLQRDGTVPAWREIGRRD